MPVSFLAIAAFEDKQYNYRTAKLSEEVNRKSPPGTWR